MKRMFFFCVKEGGKLSTSGVRGHIIYYNLDKKDNEPTGPEVTIKKKMYKVHPTRHGDSTVRGLRLSTIKKNIETNLWGDNKSPTPVDT